MSTFLKPGEEKYEITEEDLLVELWGAHGGGPEVVAYRSKPGYVSFRVQSQQGQTLNLSVAGSTTNKDGGFGGGGQVKADSEFGWGGGGASSVHLKDTLLGIAAGGGGCSIATSDHFIGGYGGVQGGDGESVSLDAKAFGATASSGGQGGFDPLLPDSITNGTAFQGGQALGIGGAGGGGYFGGGAGYAQPLINGTYYASSGAGGSNFLDTSNVVPGSSLSRVSNKPNPCLYDGCIRVTNFKDVADTPPPTLQVITKEGSVFAEGDEESELVATGFDNYLVEDISDYIVWLFPWEQEFIGATVPTKEFPPGKHGIKVSITDALGRTVSQELVIFVISPPALVVTADPGVVFPEGTNVKIIGAALSFSGENISSNITWTLPEFEFPPGESIEFPHLPVGVYQLTAEIVDKSTELNLSTTVVTTIVVQTLTKPESLQLTLVSPISESMYNWKFEEINFLAFAATGTKDESSEIQWFSDLYEKGETPFATGGYITDTAFNLGLPVGWNTIAARLGKVQQSVKILIYSVEIAIKEPEPNSYFKIDDEIQFVCVVVPDPKDLPFVSQLEWDSDLAGFLGSTGVDNTSEPPELTSIIKVALPLGRNVVTASLAEKGMFENYAPSAEVIVFVEPNPLPLVVILAPSDCRHYTEGETIEFIGNAESSGPKIRNLDEYIVWTSNLLPEPFGQGPTFTTDKLPPGEHIITAHVTDPDTGQVSEFSITLFIDEVACVAERTLVTLFDTECPIELLHQGHLVRDFRNQTVRVQGVVRFQFPSYRVIELGESSISQASPRQTLHILRGHPILIDGREVTVDKLINHSNIRQVTMDEPLTMYTLITDDRTFVEMQGVWVGTWSAIGWMNFVENDPRGLNMEWKLLK